MGMRIHWLTYPMWVAFVCVAAFTLAQEKPLNQPAKTSVDAERILSWVRELNHDEYEVREAAQNNLVSAGSSAIRPLIEALQSAEPEVSWRCGEILQRLSIEGDDGTEAALIKATTAALKSSRHPGLHAFAKELGPRRRERRHFHAKVRLTSLGAQIHDPMDFGDEILDDDGVDVDVGLPAVVERIEIEDLEADPVEAEVEIEAAPVEAVPEVEDEPAKIPDVEMEEEAPALEPVPEVPEVAEPEEPGGIEAFRELEAKGLEAKDAKEVEAKVMEAIRAAKLKGADDPPAVMLGGPVFLGGGIIDVFDPDGSPSPGHLAIDTTFRGEESDLKVVKELLNIGTVVLRNAKMGDAALKHVAQMPKLRSLNVELGAFTSEGLRAFRKARPEVTFFAKGAGVLGIQAATGGRCTIESVFPGTGAAEAGLQVADEIIEVGGAKVESFADLTSEVYPRKPGDSLKVVYLRDGNRRECTIVLKPRDTIERVPR